MVSGAQAAAISSSWSAFVSKLGGDNGEIGKAFFIKLFEMFPADQNMLPKFKGKDVSGDVLKPHGGKVIAQLAAMVAAAGDPGKLAGLMSGHGKLHKGVSIPGKYMDDASATLAALMTATIDFSGDAKSAWAALFGEMKAAIDG